MRDDQLTTACQRLDEVAYLAGLQSVADIENRACGLIPPGERLALEQRTKRNIRQNRKRALERRMDLLSRIPLRAPMTTRELSETTGRTVSALTNILPALERDGVLVRRAKMRRDDNFRWERIK